MQQPPCKKSRKPLVFDCFADIVLLIVIIIIAAVVTGCSSSQATTPDATPSIQVHATTAPTALPTHVSTEIPTVAPTAKPTQSGISATHGTPRLGSPLSDFIGAYGQPNDHSTPGSSYHFLRGANSNIDGLIIAPTLAISSQQIDDITVAATSDLGWTLSDAANRCLAYAPTDARLKQRIPYADGTGYDVIYTSSSLAKLFPASEFTDASQNPVTPGTFDISYLYRGDQQHIDCCDLITGSQQTNG